MFFAEAGSSAVPYGPSERALATNPILVLSPNLSHSLPHDEQGIDLTHKVEFLALSER
jgi:hypothetical protein